MSITWTFTFRAVIVLGLSAHVFLMYNLARVLNGGFGMNLGTIVLAVLFSAAMLIPLFWVVCLADVPEMLLSQRAQRRFSNGQCPSCGYNCENISSATCPECGTALLEPARYQWTWQTLRRYVVLNVIAMLIGVGFGESLLTFDELMFRREASTLELQQFPSTVLLSRNRIWPNNDSNIRYDTLTGFTARNSQ